MKDKFIRWIKENIGFIIFLCVLTFLCNYKLPYYINTPGGVISINDRIDCSECKDINGSLNMIYVSEYEATIPTYLLSFVLSGWDSEKMSNQQVNNESMKEITARGKVMLNNSIDNATIVAYESASKDITINKKETVVIASSNKNIKIGDEILEVDSRQIDDVREVKDIISKKNINDYIKIKVMRDGKKIDLEVKIRDIDGNKVIGVIIVTNYDYSINPKLDIKFRPSEAGSSGGLMMALSIYTKISDKDIVKGRKIAGTGTIDKYGNVGSIDGVKYKIMGAYKNKVDIVLVPRDNYKEALKIIKKYNYKMKLVKVDTFDDAIKYLSK